MNEMTKALLLGASRRTAVTPEDKYFAFSEQSFPRVRVYRYDDSTISSPTFSELTVPSIFSGSVYSLAFGDGSVDARFLAIGTSEYPYLLLYSRTGDVYNDSGGISGGFPPSYVLDCMFSPSSTYLTAAHFDLPYITIYKENSGTYSKLSVPLNVTPAFAGVGNGSYGCAFSPNETYFAVAHGVDPYLYMYSRSGDSFTKVSDPTSKPTGIAFAVGFSPDNTLLAVGHATSPFLSVYHNNSGSLTKLTAAPSVLPAGPVFSVSFSANGNYLAVGCSPSGDNPGLLVYTVSGSGVGTTLSSSGLSVPFGFDSSINRVTWGNENNYLSVGRSSFLQILNGYRTSDKNFLNAGTTGLTLGSSVFSLKWYPPPVPGSR